MQVDSYGAEVQTDEHLARPDFVVLIAYEGPAQGWCATQFFHTLCQDFGELFDFSPCFLRFEELRNPHAHASLARHLSQADMVVIAAAHRADLPGEVKAWTRSWACVEEAETKALVALVNGDAAPSPVTAFLHDVAKEKRMKFLCKQTAWPDQPAAVAPAAQLHLQTL